MPEEKVIRNSARGLDTIFSEEYVGTVVEINLMVFAMPNKSWDYVEYELCFVDWDYYWRDFVEAAISDYLNPRFHLFISAII